MRRAASMVLLRIASLALCGTGIIVASERSHALDDWVPAHREANATVWQAGDGSGRQYTEFGSGLNHIDPDGHWQPSRERILLLPDGTAEALEGQYQVRFEPNLNRAGSIQITGASGQVFRTHPLGVFYFDAATGRSALVAGLKDSTGELLPPNQIVYRDAFEGLRIDVRLTYTKAAFESDVILLEQPPGPELYGLDPETTRLEIWTEFLDVPEPESVARVLRSEEDEALRDRMVEPDLIDETLDFGDLWLPLGRAFVGSADADERDQTEPARIELPKAGEDSATLLVAKRWLEIDRRRLLVEAVEWREVKSALPALPVSDRLASTDLRGRVTEGRVPPATRHDGIWEEPIRLAAAGYRETGLVIDYIAVNPSGSYTFLAGETYYISSSGYLSSATFHPDSVIKLANNAYVLIYSWATCYGTSPNPTIVTSKDDDLFGETIAGSTGNPTFMGSPALWDYYSSNGIPFSGMKVRWAKTAFRFDANYGGSSYYRQVVNTVVQQSQQGVVTGPYATVYLSNYAVCGVGTPINGNAWSDDNPYQYPTVLVDPTCADDSDSDGLPDTWEITHFGNITAQTGTMDADGDGLSNLEEWQHGLDPNSSDTDYDGRSDFEELLEGTDPLDHTSFTPVRLGYWRFNSPDWQGEQGQLPKATQGVQSTVSWSGTAAGINDGAGAHLKYECVEADGSANINLRRGTLRFWFRPHFSSGQNIGSWGRLLEVGAWSADASYGHWNFRFNPTMTDIAFVTSSNGVSQTHFNHTGLNWTAGDWHQIVLTYSPQQTRLYLDGQLVKTGTGVSRWPDATVRAKDGLPLGSNKGGGEQARGHFDELEIFNYPLTSAQIAEGMDMDSDGLPDVWEILYGLDPFDPTGNNGADGDPDGDGLTNIEEYLLGTDPTVNDLPGGGTGAINIHTPLE
jgi:hypothetical protein